MIVSSRAPKSARDPLRMCEEKIVLAEGFLAVFAARNDMAVVHVRLRVIVSSRAPKGARDPLRMCEERSFLLCAPRKDSGARTLPVSSPLRCCAVAGAELRLVELQIIASRTVAHLSVIHGLRELAREMRVNDVVWLHDHVRSVIAEIET